MYSFFISPVELRLLLLRNVANHHPRQQCVSPSPYYYERSKLDVVMLLNTGLLVFSGL